MIRKLALALALCALAPFSIPANASQGSGCLPTSGVISGLTYTQDLNAALAALISSNSGNAAPLTDCSGATITGQWWLDTSTAPPTVRMWDGTAGLPVGRIDTINHLWAPPVGGGSVSNTIAAAATVDLGSAPTSYVTVTGSGGPITSFGSSAQVGSRYQIVFSGTPTVTYNGASLIIPGAASITVAAGDVWEATYLGGGNWRVTSINTASGAPVVPEPTGSMKMWLGFTAPTGYIFANGQSLVAATYANLDAVINVNETGSTVNTSNIVSGLASTSNLYVGFAVCGTGIPTSTTVTSVDSSSQVHISNNASATGTPSLRFAPYGCAGGGSPTFNVPDLRGRVVAGVDNMGGAGLANRMNGCANSSTPGVTCGAQSVTIAQNQLPNVAPTASFSGNPVTPTGSFTGTQNTWGLNQTAPVATFQPALGASTGGTGYYSLQSNTAQTDNVTITPAGSISINSITPSGSVTVNSINGNVTQQAMNVLPPEQMFNIIIKY